MIAARQIQPLDDAELDEQVQGAEQGRPADAEAPITRDRGQLGRREVPVMGGDQVGERQARRGQPVAGVVERADDRVRSRAWPES